MFRAIYIFSRKKRWRDTEEAGFTLVRKECSNRIYSMHPVNWLRYYVYRFLKKRAMEWSDIQFAAAYQADKRRGGGSMDETLHFFWVTTRSTPWTSSFMPSTKGISSLRGNMELSRMSQKEGSCG